MGMVMDSSEDDERADAALESSLAHCGSDEHRAAMLVLLVSRASTRLAILRGTQEAAGLLEGIKGMLQSLPPIKPPGTH